ncbi:MAG TPA: acetyl-CoA carboxylase biotin carboxyl carrier protein [Thermomicrobiales bacterium]|nr:acetyl-CoA carboxylase biotin carboxyl carrier protein [Thermomicrobiales bacterium]HQZ88681.1 acetyl-CoA carboxylase biotin carboxyl carrier protein [Thermomicrobiales bacterium]HRA32022.1 acetyl-CoA carboxylase biotin carboxyl carrier protein [Thermomicrobiales bacterium]
MNDDSETQHNGHDESLGSDDLATLVQSLIGMMRSGNIQRLDLDYRDLRLKLRAGQVKSARVPGNLTQQIVDISHAEHMQPNPDEHHTITAPMIGTFYVASAPNEPPFVQSGDRVEEGQTIGIIEAMKIMNEIAADRAGTVIEVIAGNAQAVEYGSPLVKIRPDGV